MRNKVIEVDFTKDRKNINWEIGESKKTKKQLPINYSQTKSKNTNQPSLEEVIQEWWIAKKTLKNQEKTRKFLLDDSLTESEDVNQPSLEEAIQWYWNVNASESELKQTLNESDEIVKISPDELKRYVFHVIMWKIMKKKELTTEYYSCSDYLSGLITSFIMNKIQINKNCLELVNEQNWADFQRIWDIHFLRYATRYDQRKNSAYSKQDLINQAVMFYDMAYQWHERTIGMYLSSNLKEFDSILNFRNFTKSVFQGRI